METLDDIWHYLVAGATLVISAVASGHAVLYKRDSRATILWVGAIWIAPLIGALFYFMLGINRIRRKAANLRSSLERFQDESSKHAAPLEDLFKEARPNADHLVPLARLVDRVNARPLVKGNLITPLINGDQTFPTMLQAIEEASDSINLCTYIFDTGKAGERFIDALARAVQRGVEVRVLIDDTGARYSWPSVIPRLRRRNIRVERFLPTKVPFRVMAINMRNHRKILVADSQTAFTGGLNIRDGHWLKEHPRRPVQDIHFQVQGPIVAHLQEVFAEDWLFCTGETLHGPRWFPPLPERGEVIARGIADGPDEDFESLRLTLVGALAAARHYLRIVTPYFLPDQSLIFALNVAAMRGVQVDIVLPQKNNLPFVHWAMFAQLWQVLERGCRVWLTPPPFDHSKLLIVDDYWALVGSANWDMRSLRLNFEFNVECYHHDTAVHLRQLSDEKIKYARQLTLQEVDQRSLPIRLRDGVARLAAPFL